MTRLISRRTVARFSFLAFAVGASGTALAQSTFYRDVLPILQDNCQICHRPGQIGPFSMLSYDEVRPYARSMKKQVLQRAMPPWFADPGVGHFANDPSLADEEIQTIVQWVDGGAPAGNPAQAPKPVAWPADGWRIKPDHVVKGAEHVVPKDGLLDWMYMAMPTGFTEDTWVTSMEMRPGSDPSLTHHYCVFIVPKLTNVEYGVPATQQQLGVGSDGFDGCYEPGQEAFDYRPYQAGRMIPANSDVVFQMHYVPQGKKVSTDQPQIGFTIANARPPRQFVFQNIGFGAQLSIPPLEPNYKAPMQEAELTVDAQIVWLQGHAHYRAKEMLFTIAYPDGRTEPALHLHWHPFWQQLYYPTEPIVAPKGTRLLIEAWYDNSQRNRFNPDPNAHVKFGLLGTDEMMFPTFGFLVDGSFDATKMKVGAPSPRADFTFTIVEPPADSPVAAR